MSKKPAPRAPAPLTRKQLSRRERERVLTQRLIVGTAVVLGLVLLILGWGLYEQYVLQPRSPVATVAGTPIRLDTYQRLVRYRRWDYQSYLNNLESQRQQLLASKEDQSFYLQYIGQQIEAAQQELMTLPTMALEELIEDQLVRQECARRSISVTSEEVQNLLEQQFGYDRNANTEPPEVASTEPITATPIPTVPPMSEAEFVEQSSEWFQLVRKYTGFTEQDFRRLLESILYRQKLEDALTADMPTTGEQIKARHILLETEEEAQQVLERLEQGEHFEDLAAELSVDVMSGVDGGDLGWFGRGQMDPDFEQAAFALQPGEVSAIVQTTYGFHIIRVDEYDPNRALDEATLSNQRTRIVQDWLSQQRATQEIVRNWSSKSVPADLPAASRR